MSSLIHLLRDGMREAIQDTGMHNEVEGGDRVRGCTFSRPKSRSLSGKEDGRDFSSLELEVPIIERPNLLNASCVAKCVRQNASFMPSPLSLRRV